MHCGQKEILRANLEPLVKRTGFGHFGRDVQKIWTLLHRVDIINGPSLHLLRNSSIVCDCETDRPRPRRSSRASPTYSYCVLKSMRDYRGLGRRPGVYLKVPNNPRDRAMSRRFHNLFSHRRIRSCISFFATTSFSLSNIWTF